MTVLETSVPGLPVIRGKVRDVYDLGDGRLVLVATDRLSAFDRVFPNGVPDKGRILTALSAFWFDRLGTPHHAIGTDLGAFPPPFADRAEVFAGRSMLVRRTRVIAFECVARGYLAGSGWREYRQRGSICGVSLPPGLVQSERLPEPIFTPATKAERGEHDENVSFDRLVEALGGELAEELRGRTLALYGAAADHAAARGVLLADTKFEFGLVEPEPGEDRLLLVDEALTPDSSRYWPAEFYEPGGPQVAFDKQFVRDWLESIGFDKESTPPPLPDDVAAKTRECYLEAYRRLTGRAFR